jgi:ribosomal protein S12 methylthiotransferase accessory factor
MNSFFWNPEFRCNIVSPRQVIIFSRDQYIVIFDEEAAEIITAIIGRYRRKLRPTRAIKRLSQLLLETGVLSSKRLSSIRKHPSSRSFFSTSALRGVGSRTKLAIRKLAIGADRLIYQFSSNTTKFGSRQITRFAASGLVRSGESCIPIFSSGASVNCSEAAAKFVGESFERRDCATWNESDLVFGQPNELPSPYIDPKSIVSFGETRYGQSDFPFRRFDRSEKYYWSSVLTADTGEKKYVPAQFVYSPFAPRLAEPRLWLNTTSGVAAGRTKQSAILRAILELVERDAALTTWYVSRLVRKLSGWEHLIQSSIALSMSARSKIEVYTMTGVVNYPCILATVQCSNGTGPFISCGTAADITYKAAVRRAVIDAILTYQWLAKEGFQKIQEPNDIRRKQDHACLYAHSMHANEFSFLYEAKILNLEETRDVSSRDVQRQALSRVVSELKSRGYRIWLKGLATPQTRKSGYYVERALIPGLIPLQFGADSVPTGLHRLKDVVSTSPHPFG